MKPTREAVARWNQVLSPYFGPDAFISTRQLLVTAGLFFITWYAMLRSLEVGFWLTLLLAFPAAGFLMRLFMIQHDCGHGSFFNSKRLQNAVGFWIGVLTLTPYDYWRKTHAIHHSHSGDLTHRGFGDIDTLTIDEYLALTRLQRFKYRLYRSPFVLFGVGAVFHFLVIHRLPPGTPRTWKREWSSIWRTNLALAGIVALAWWLIGIERFLLVQLPITILASALGVWLFYVQHQFEETYWHWHEQWDYYDAGLHGSSYLVLPGPLRWFTASIGLHHVHHLSSRIPNYKLKKCHDDNPELWEVTRMTIRDGLRTLGLALWDEKRRQLITFRDLRRLRTHTSGAAG